MCYCFSEPGIILTTLGVYLQKKNERWYFNVLVKVISIFEWELKSHNKLLVGNY